MRQLVRRYAEVIWVTILSAAVNRDSEKALQVPLNAETERPGMQMQEQLDNEFSLVVNGRVGYHFSPRYFRSQNTSPS